ncbi:MAG: heavy-metal-associated domain-containing protein [Notoacmeibacter sp.]|nr:heavy-metal-associated domain-containing protein [Notoacmeibacter sp.]
METILKIDGMTCGGCASTVQKVLGAQDKVQAVAVDRASGTARVTHEGAHIPALVNAVEDAGFDAAEA